MKTPILSIVVLFILAGLTNPTRDQHITEVRGVIVSNVLAKSVSHPTSQRQNETPASVFGLTLGTVAIKEMVDTFVSVDDYVFLSLTRITHNDQSRVVGVGVFGKVWVSEDLRHGVTSLAGGE
ncbi:hypothetical protein WBG78_14200 [Chryseolinea sp. T2]|uniref:hypothetical protein n=1 Tax=Chryseolinea sp. T2 TaxID=3129255 RepID=UPI0030773B12